MNKYIKALVTSAVLLTGVGTASIVTSNSGHYVFASAEKVAGRAYTGDFVAVVKKGYPIYDSYFDGPSDTKASLGQVLDNTTNMMYNTFEVTDYDYLDGDLYYQIQDHNGDLFLISAVATSKVTNADGLPIKSDFYVRITDQWGSTRNRPSSDNSGYLYDYDTMYNKIYHVKTIYHPRNSDSGTVYSIYSNKNKWMGYMESSDADKITKIQGPAHSTKQYVSLRSKNYSIWSGFDFKTVKHYSKNYYQKTYLVKTYYNHFNGHRYDSLYTASGKWFGYINASGVAVGKGAQGAAVSANKRVTVKSKSYYTYSNFSWKKKSKSSSLYNKKYTVKTIYHHASGSIYYSLYSGSKWMGYINSKAVR